MRWSIKAKQVAGVTSIVGAAVILLSAIHLASLARVGLEESRSRGEMLAHAIFQRAHEVVPAAADPYAAIRDDSGVRSLLESSIAYSRNVTYAAVVDRSDVAVAHSFRTLEGMLLPPQGDLNALIAEGAVSQLRAIYDDRTLEIGQPLLLGDERFGSIRIGVSTLLIRNDLEQALRPAAATALVALAVATLVAMLLAQWLLRPIHVIKSGLSRLGRGELGVKLDLPPGDEFGELGTTFDAVSAQLSAIQERASGQSSLQTAFEHLEDAIAIFGADGHLLFANQAMRATLPPGTDPGAKLPDTHPFRALVLHTVAARQPQGPVSMPVLGGDDAAPAEYWVMTHPIQDAEHRFVGAMLFARNLEYLNRVQSTINYSRKLKALGRILAGVAHEVKNPLNAMTIHLELLKQKLAAATRASSQSAVAAGTVSGARASTAVLTVTNGAAQPAPPAVMTHVDIIANEIRRLDQAVQGFLKFTRPGELRLRPVQLRALVDDVARVVGPEAEKAGVAIHVDCAADAPDINGDPDMLQQALMNLALNAIQAMPNGGALRFACRGGPGRYVELDVEDTGLGIAPEHLERIFDLYFTTKEHGSGIGLSLVYRIVQLHDGEVEVRSVPGTGTTFKLMLPKT